MTAISSLLAFELMTDHELLVDVQPWVVKGFWIGTARSTFFYCNLSAMAVILAISFSSGPMGTGKHVVEGSRQDCLRPASSNEVLQLFASDA